jgi:hypothetical protein
LATLQAIAHLPQLFESVFRFASQPLAGLPSQSAKPFAHLATVQVPALHAAVAFARLHAPHLPQLLTSVFRFASQPLDALPSQSAKPLAHVPTAHLPALQVGVALARLQTIAQAPQLRTSCWASTHVPLQME